MKPICEYALSVKQPWATLIVHGVKTIEIRGWPTARRGKIYIHAARVADDRPHGWKLLPKKAAETANLRGGFIGIAEIVDCLTYKTREEFTRDKDLHLNDPSWFTDTSLYGFRFTGPEIVEFQSFPGWLRFFSATTPVIKEKVVSDPAELY
jgi:hypothetical protein